MLSPEQVETFGRTGHLTVQNVFDGRRIETLLADVDAWSREFLQTLEADQHQWYLEGGKPGAPLRKLDNPVHHRPAFRELAASQPLVGYVEQLIGESVSVFFSQLFCKPPEVGGPKPVHQDNFYFGPDDDDATLTVWIALDDATTENGCLYFGDGSHRGPIHAHTAPENEPFNLQVPGNLLAEVEMTPAPVRAGGVSFHHGTTLHQSSANTSAHPRRAVAMHYLRNNATLIRPALAYDSSLNVRIT